MMCFFQFYLYIIKEIFSDVEFISYCLMLCVGMICKLVLGLYIWFLLGLCVLCKVECIVCEEMDCVGVVEFQILIIQFKELWEVIGWWEKFGLQLFKIKDCKEQVFCYSFIVEEVVVDFVCQELFSYKQLLVNFYQIQIKFCDEICLCFGVMCLCEFLMKDVYFFYLYDECLV